MTRLFRLLRLKREQSRRLAARKAERPAYRTKAIAAVSADWARRGETARKLKERGLL
jgi:hypothetical protein